MLDLIDIPGLSALLSHTKGDPRLKIAVLDGPIDLDRACFQGANLTALQTVSAEQETADESLMRRSLSSFLNRVYYDL